LKLTPPPTIKPQALYHRVPMTWSPTFYLYTSFIYRSSDRNPTPTSNIPFFTGMPLVKAKPEGEAFGAYSPPKSSFWHKDEHKDEVPVTRKRSIFSSKSGSKSPPKSPAHHPANASTSGPSSFFHHRRSGSTSSSDRENSTRNNKGFLGIGRSNHLKDDPSIRGAREKVTDAVNAEKEADHALNEARQRVRLARQHVKDLEREALEE